MNYYNNGWYIQLVADKNVELITSSLTGKSVPDILADFKSTKKE